MADAADSKSVGRKAVWVRLPPPAPITLFKRSIFGSVPSNAPKELRLANHQPGNRLHPNGLECSP